MLWPLRSERWHCKEVQRPQRDLMGMLLIVFVRYQRYAGSIYAAK